MKQLVNLETAPGKLNSYECEGMLGGGRWSVGQFDPNWRARFRQCTRTAVAAHRAHHHLCECGVINNGFDEKCMGYLEMHDKNS